MSNTGKRVLAVILAIILALGSGLAGGFIGAKVTASKLIQNVETSSDASQTSSVDINLQGDVTIAEAVSEKVMPSVVGISTVSTQTTSGFYGFGSYTGDATSVGTGVIVDEDGYILTNSHVVNDGDYKSITVSLYDGNNVEGTVLWNEPILDLAIVKIDAEGMNLTAAELGDSDTVKIGSYALVIGNPLGLRLERSVTEGIISGLNRTITVSDGTGSSTTTMEGMIQTDATINSGNSGGPLLNAAGQVVGIASARSGSGESLGFAIPINTAKPVVEQIKETGSFSRVYIGISGVGLGDQTQYTEDQLESYFGTSKGIYVNSVTKGGGADAAGLQQGDIILTVDGKEVTTMNGINTIVYTKSDGDKVEIEYLRDGKQKTCTVTVHSGSILTQ